MGTRASATFIGMTAFWGVIGIICPILIQFCMGRSPNKGIIQIMFIMTAGCCYLFWLCTFLFQLNPLIGPQLNSDLIRYMQAEWEGHPTTNRAANRTRRLCNLFHRNLDGQWTQK